MTYNTAANTLKSKPPRVSLILLSIETVAMLVVAYLLVQIFS